MGPDPIVDPMQVPIRGGQSISSRRAARTPPMTTSSTQTCYVALELSRTKWLVGALSRCRLQARLTAFRPVSGRDTSRVAPCLKCPRSEEAMDAGRDKMTRDSKEVVGGRVQGQEPLG
jgi:hypothetical protein